jgi:predicted exporter
VKPAYFKAGTLVCLIIAAFVVIVSRINVSTDLGLFLPEAETQFDELLRHQLDNGASTNIILVAFSGLERELLAEFNKSFSEALRNTSIFSKVTNGAAALGEEALSFLETNRYLLTHNNLEQQFSAEGFSAALDQRIEGLASTAAPMEKRYLRRDPTGEVLGLLEEWQGKVSRFKKPNERHGVWFSKDESRTLILAEIGSDIRKMKNQIEAVTVIRTTFEDMRLPGIEVVMAGPAVFAVESGEDIRADVRNLTLVAVFIVVLFLLAVYRSFRMMVLVLCPLLAGVIAATAAILLIYGQVHGITLAFGITLAGVAVDYPIHLLTGMGAEKLKGNSSNSDHISKIWKTLRLGVFSTVIAYAAFLVSGFSGLQQLGMFTIVGLITAALFSRWVLPYLVVSRIDTMPGLTGFHCALKNVCQRSLSLRFVVPGVLFLALLALTISDRNILHLNVDSLSPINETRRAEGKMLRNDLGFWYGGSMMLLTAPDKEAVLQYSEFLQPYLDDLVTQSVIEGYDMAAHFLPSVKTQQKNQQQLLESGKIAENLAKALADTPFRSGVFEPFLDDLATSAQLRPLNIESLESSVIGKNLSSLVFDFKDDSGGVILLHGVNDDVKIKEFADSHEDLYYMHLKTASTDLVARSVDRVSLSMLGCIFIIYISLGLAFRNFTRPLKIMIPTFSAAVTAAAILVFSGNPLSIFHLISLLLVVGLGLDYALFFNRLPDNDEEWDTTFKSLWVCAITTILVFGILMFSNTPPLKAIGITVGIGAFLSMIFAAMWAACPDKKAHRKFD